MDEFAARARWALGLLRSPRVRESDAAALLMRLLLRKYAVDLGWDVTLSPRPMASVRECEKRTKGETAARLLGECPTRKLVFFSQMHSVFPTVESVLGGRSEDICKHIF